MERLDSELSEYAEGARGHVRVLANVSSIMEFLPEELSDFMLEESKYSDCLLRSHALRQESKILTGLLTRLRS